MDLNDDNYDAQSSASGPFHVVRPSDIFEELKEDAVLTPEQRRLQNREYRRMQQELKAAETKVKATEFKMAESKLNLGMTSMSLGGHLGNTTSYTALTAPPLSRAAQITAQIAAAAASAADDADIPAAEAKAALNVTRDADTLATYLLGLNFSNPYTFGRVPVSASKVAAATNADGKGVEAVKFSRHLLLGRALAMQQKYAVWHNEWTVLCGEISEANQRVTMVEANQQLQILKRDLLDASRDAKRKVSDERAAGKATIAAAVSAVQAKMETAESKQPAGTNKRKSASSLQKDREDAKRLRAAGAAATAAS